MDPDSIYLSIYLSIYRLSIIVSIIFFHLKKLASASVAGTPAPIPTATRVSQPPAEKQPSTPWPAFIPKRVLSVWERIPAFRGTIGMTWEDALEYVVLKDVEHVQANPEERGLRRGAIRHSWLFKMIDNIEEDEMKEQKKVNA